MKDIIRNKLFEDPDESYAKDSYPLMWNDPGSYPFGFNFDNGKVGVGNEGKPHSSIDQYHRYAGRIWPEAGVIAFWEAPRKDVLMKMLRMIIRDREMRQYSLTMSDFEDFLFDIPSEDDYDGIRTLAEYPENPTYIDPDIIPKPRPEHTVSPINKKNQPTSYSGGSKLTAWDSKQNIKQRAAERTSESLVRPSINESPDMIYIKELDAYHSFMSSDTYPFTFIDDVAYIGDQGDTHGSIMPQISKEDKERLNINYTSNIRFATDYPGRFWLNDKIISFWKYPETKQKLFHLLNKLIRATDKHKLNFFPYDDDWFIELPKIGLGEARIIPINDYISSEDQPKEEFNKDHVKSPMLKHKKPVTSGGSKKYGKQKPLAWRQALQASESLVSESLDEAMVGDVAIADVESYIGGMSKSAKDKTDFLSNIDVDCIVDFGCADGYILNTIHKEYPKIKGLIGYDIDDDMINLIKSKYPNIQATDNWNEAVYLAGEYGKVALSLMSVIHEVYTYSTSQTIRNFWRKQVFNPKFDYVVIRDMMPAKEYWKEKPSPEDIKKLKWKLWKQKKYQKSFEKNWGNITDNMGNLLHWFLKYDYKSNWGREVKENYFPVSLETVKSKIPPGWKIVYEDHYIFPPIANKVRRDFGIELKHPTHMKMIIKNENSKN